MMLLCVVLSTAHSPLPKVVLRQVTPIWQSRCYPETRVSQLYEKNEIQTFY